MTRRRIYGADTAFGVWFRDRAEFDSVGAGLSVQNLDYVWHWYRLGIIMLIEEKTRQGRCSFAQRRTHSALDQLLRLSDGNMVTLGSGPPQPIRYGGYHVIRFENTSPRDGWTEIDGLQVSEKELVQFLEMKAPPSMYGFDVAKRYGT